MRFFLFVWGFLVGVTLVLGDAGDFKVIAHRGASGYVPEHTMIATAMAHGMGAHFIEQDVVITKDSAALVIHDIYLDTTTNVARVFPGRHRNDGRYYVSDFTVDELRLLRKGERINLETGEAVYPRRFPAGQYDFPLMFLEEAVSLIEGMDNSTGRKTGLYPELKKPEAYKGTGIDPISAFMKVLRTSGALSGERPCYIQCFHADSLIRIRKEFGKEVTLIQLVGYNSWDEASTDYDAMLTEEGIAKVGSYADGIGLPLNRLLSFGPEGIQWSPVKDWAQKVGLKIHPYTVRKETVPEGISVQQLMDLLASEPSVGGVFTDFPDIHPSQLDK